MRHSTRDSQDAPLLKRVNAEGALPEVRADGTAYECGQILGSTWKEALTLGAEHAKSDKPWWKDPHYAKLISRIAPHLPDLYRGMAAGAGLKEDMISTRATGEGGCTSFALQPAATLDGAPISGQSKDVSMLRGMQMCVLRARMTDAPSMLSLTYPGWLFGHGFVQGGTSIFRNSLYVQPPDSGLPFAVWGILALHCKTVEEVVELVRKYGVRASGHSSVADERGGIVGIEFGRGGAAFLRPKRGIYTHANCIMQNKRLQAQEKEDKNFKQWDSLNRTVRLRERLEVDRGRLTAQLAYGAMCDHGSFPNSVCRHQSLRAMTASVVVVEPTRRLLHATRGCPCQNWPHTYSLDS